MRFTSIGAKCTLGNIFNIAFIVWHLPFISLPLVNTALQSGFFFCEKRPNHQQFNFNVKETRKKALKLFSLAMNNTTNSINSQSLHVCDFYVKVEVDIVDVFTVAINMVLSVSAMLGNTLVLVAIRRTTALWLPTKILLSSLAFADLGVGLLAEPLFAMKILLEGRLVRCVVGVLFDVVSGHLSIASFLTMMAISIDKCMAAQLKLRYRIVVTEIGRAHV